MSGFTQFFRNFLPFKDGGAIPPSNAMERVGNFKKPFFPQGPSLPMFRGLPKFLMPKKHGGAVKKRKTKPKKAKK